MPTCLSFIIIYNVLVVIYYQDSYLKVPFTNLFSGGLDLIFMPGLAFSKNGARLGRGKGFYDNYLAKCKHSGCLPKTVALLFHEQLVDNVPTHDHDILVDNLIYPTIEEIHSLR